MHRCYPEYLHPTRCSVEEVHNLIQRRRQLMDVLTVERSDESAIEPVDYLTRELVRLVLGDLDCPDVRGVPLRLPEQLVQKPRRERQALGELGEQFVELLVARYQPQTSLLIR